MGIDASIYANAQPVPINIASPLDTAQKAMNLSALGMQQAQMGYSMGSKLAARQAMAKNMDQNGNLNQAGFLSDLGRQYPESAMEYRQHFTEMAKNQAETLQKITDAALPKMEYLGSLSEQERARQYPEVMKKMASEGLPMENVPQDSSGNYLYDPAHFKQSLGILQKTSAYLNQQKTIAETGKLNSERNQIAVNRLTDYQKGLMNDEAWKKERGTLIEGKNTLTAIDDALTNPQSRQEIPIMLARFTTAGQRMNQTEIEQGLAKGTFGDRFKQMWEDTKTNVFTPAMADYAKQFVTTQMQSAAQNKSEIELDHAKKYSIATGLPIESAHFQLTSNMPGTIEQTPTGPARFAKNKAAPSGAGLVNSSAYADQPKGGASKQSSNVKYRAAGAPISPEEVAQYASKYKIKLSEAQNHLRGLGYAVDR